MWFMKVLIKFYFTFIFRLFYDNLHSLVFLKSMNKLSIVIEICGKKKRIQSKRDSMNDDDSCERFFQW